MSGTVSKHAGEYESAMNIATASSSSSSFPASSSMNPNHNSNNTNNNSNNNSNTDNNNNNSNNNTNHAPGYLRPQHFTHPPRDPALLLSLARYVLRGCLRGFLIGFGVKAALASLLSIALRWRRVPSMSRSHIRALLVDDPGRFGLFLGGLVGGFRLTEGLLDWIRADEHPTHTAVAGAVAGLALLLDARSRRTELALYILARAGAATTNSLVGQGMLPYWGHADTMLFVVVCSIIMWIFFYEDINFPRSYVNFFRRMEGESAKVSQKLRTLTRHYRPLW